VAVWAVDQDLVDFGAIVNFAGDTRAVKLFDPSVGAGQRIQAALEVIFPGTKERIKIA